MIRPFRDEVERYGHYSLAAESMYDHPFQWGSKRTGPGPRAGRRQVLGRWHVAHLIDPRSGRAGIGHAALRASCSTASSIRATSPLHLRANRTVGVPYTRRDDRERPGRPRGRRPIPRATTTALLARYPKAAVGDFDGDPRRLTEMDALVAYLQMLGRMVDFTDVAPRGPRSVGAGAMSDAYGWILSLWQLWLVVAVHRDRRLGVLAQAQAGLERHGEIPLRRRRSGALSHADQGREGRRSPGRRPPATSGTASRSSNTPLPKWWLYVLYATIAWAVVWWVLYPSWPGISGYFAGVLGYDQREDLRERHAAEASAARAVYLERLEAPRSSRSRAIRS